MMVISDSRSLDGSIFFWCPGCARSHSVYPRPLQNPITGASWTWNGDRDKPTLFPSILVKTEFTENRPAKVCHLFVTDGTIQYLSDCTHSMAGQTIEMVEVQEVQ